VIREKSPIAYHHPKRHCPLPCHRLLLHVCAAQAACIMRSRDETSGANLVRAKPVLSSNPFADCGSRKPLPRSMKIDLSIIKCQVNIGIYRPY
jgi:hypothetical protein